MAQPRQTLSVFLSAAMVCAASTPSFAQNVSQKDVKYLEGLLQQTKSGDPGMSRQIDSLLTNRSTSIKDVVQRRLSGPTPANVQQYSGQAADGTPERTMSASGWEARKVLQDAGTLVGQAQASAKDAPKKYVAETGGKVIGILDTTFNEVNEQVQKEISVIRGELSEMVAIALIINGSGGGGAAKTKEGEDLSEAAKRGKKAHDPDIGASIEAIIRPELPISHRGGELFKDAYKRLEALDKMIATKAGKLDEASALTQQLTAKEATYNKAMKGKGGARGTGEVLAAATTSMGNHLVMLKQGTDRIKGFMDGPGKTIYDVVQCSEDVYNAARSLQEENVSVAQIRALVNRAVDSNQKAARGVGPMARSFEGLLAWLGQDAPMDKLTPPTSDSMSAPKAGESRSGEAGKAQKAFNQDIRKVTE